MSTRATITVFDPKGSDVQESYSIYRHSDGYPESEHGVIAALQDSLQYAWMLPRFEASEFAAAVVFQMKKTSVASAGSYRGGSIYLTSGRDGHEDTAYHYDVTLKNNRILVNVFSRNADDAWVAAGKHTLT